MRTAATVAMLVCAARIVHAQPPADAVGGAVEDTLGSWRVLQRLIDVDAIDDTRTGGSPITSSVNAWLSVSVASKLAAYSFPVQLGVSPFLSTSASTWLRKSEFTASYGITSLKQTPVDLGGSQQANRVRGSAPTTVKLTYTIPVTSTDQKVSGTDLQSILAQFAPPSTTLDMDTVLASPDVRTFVERKKQDFLRAFSSSFEADYTYAWGDKTQDELDLSGNAETGFPVGSRTLTVIPGVSTSMNRLNRLRVTRFRPKIRAPPIRSRHFKIFLCEIHGHRRSIHLASCWLGGTTHDFRQKCRE
jgi:hypothetical protein